jgi:hypothetical protein
MYSDNGLVIVRQSCRLIVVLDTTVMTRSSAHLTLVTNAGSVSASPVSSGVRAPTVGCYSMDSLPASVRRVLDNATDATAAGICAGLVEDYRIYNNRVQLQEWNPESARVLCWDGDRSGLVNNSLTLLQAEMSMPLLESQADGSVCLILDLSFELQGNARAFAFETGLVRLVEPDCTLTLSDGRVLPWRQAEAERYATTEQGNRALVLEFPGEYVQEADSRSDAAVVAGRRLQDGEQQRWLENWQVRVNLPQTLHQQAITRMTLMEQYTLFWMQQALPGKHAPTGLERRWLPLMAPVQWGWSLRIERLSDGGWGIVRRKLMRPLGGNEGLFLPDWQCQRLQQEWYRAAED